MAKEYTKINRRIMVLNILISILILVIFLISGLSLGLRNTLYEFTNTYLLQVVSHK